MGTKDKRVDAYIAKSAPFARPILSRLRSVVHAACPDVRETVKWSFPHFEHHGILCSMAAFKQHCSFGFWKASIIEDPAGILATRDRESMGNMGRLTTVRDLPPKKVLESLVREAARLNEQGVPKPTKPRPVKRAPLRIPEFLKKALRSNKKAAATFEELSYSHKKEYVEWLTEAKTPETREKRLATAIEWMNEGKPRNWKYMKK